MKKVIFLTGIIFVVAALLSGLLGCSSSTPVTTPSLTPTPTTSPTAAPITPTTPVATQKPSPSPSTSPSPTATTPAKVYTLKWADLAAPTGTRMEGIAWMTQEIEKRSNGRVKFEMFYAQSLLKSTEMLKGVGSGVADIGNAVASYAPAELALWNHVLVPIKAASLAKQVEWFYSADNEFPALREEFEKLNLIVIARQPWSGNDLFAKKPVKSLADMNGMKIRGSGSTAENILGAVGAVHVFLAAPDVYAGLEKNTIDGAEYPWDAAFRQSLVEVTKYVTPLNRATTTSWYSMNLSTWNTLPKDIQEIIMKVGRELAGRMATQLEQEATTLKERFVKEYKGEVVDMPATEIAKWQAMPAVKKVVDDWIDAREKEGRPGKAIMDRYMQFLN